MTAVDADSYSKDGQGLQMQPLSHFQLGMLVVIGIRRPAVRSRATRRHTGTLPISGRTPPERFCVSMPVYVGQLHQGHQIV